jgi:membrane protease YdiL (CAAX protease family)
LPTDKIYSFLTGGSEYTEQAQFLGGFVLRLTGFIICLLLLISLGYIKCMKFNRTGFLNNIKVIWPAIIMIAIPLPYGSIIGGGFNIDASLLVPMILKYIGVGMIEEGFFRAAILVVLLAAWGQSKKGIYKAVIVSSVFFGVVHLMNLLFLFDGVDVLASTMAQIVYASLLGIFFAGLYLRNKNIWIIILIHALIDIAGGLNQIAIRTGSVPASAGILEVILQCAVIVPFGIYGLFVLRKVENEDLRFLDISTCSENISVS